ncbi:protein kinase [Streptomyces nitrosporeus]|uniref:protein kinase n=1 Tax=Streptomyces nitrosporeus TaxID=28894 RepID=UPI0033176722
MDDYAGRVLADRYRLPLPPSDAYELAETRAFDTYSGQEVLVRQVPLPEVVDAEVLDADGTPTARRATGRAVRRPTDPAVRRAIEAAQAAAQVPDHPRLDQVFDVFAEAGSLWIVSELVAARPLAALLAERPLNPYRAAEIGSDVLTALRVLHAHGWTHRNITVRTVLVCDDGRVVLTGLAAGAAEEALCGYVPVPQPDGEGGGYGPPAVESGPTGPYRPPSDPEDGPEPAPDGDETAEPAAVPASRGHREIEPAPPVPGGPGPFGGTAPDRREPVSRPARQGVPAAPGALPRPGGPPDGHRPPGPAAPARPSDPARPSAAARQPGPSPYARPARPIGPAGPAGPAVPGLPAGPAAPAGPAGPERPVDPGRPPVPGQAAVSGRAVPPSVPADPAAPTAPPAEPGAGSAAQLRAARAGAIAAYRAGARAAARANDDQQQHQEGGGSGTDHGPHADRARQDRGSAGTGGSPALSGPPAPGGVWQSGGAWRSGEVPASGGTAGPPPDGNGAAAGSAAPGAPGVPATPGAPGTTASSPGAPAGPEAPADSEAPTGPETPAGPEAPTGPETPAGPEATGGPETPAGPAESEGPAGRPRLTGAWGQLGRGPYDGLYEDPYDDEGDDEDDEGPGEGGPGAGGPPPGRRVHLTGTWDDGPLSGRPVPAGGSPGNGSPGAGGDASRADGRLPAPGPGRDRDHDERLPQPVGARAGWDEVVAGAGTPAYRGPATPLAAERARQARIAVVGAVTERWAPEQAGPVHDNWQLAPPIGPSTDLWALGALLYRAVQGHAPYPEENAAELVQMVCGEPPAFAEECGPLRPVVESLLRQDPTERPDFEELRGWLRSLIRSAPEPEAGLDVVPLPPADTARLPVVRRRGELVRKRRGRGAAHGRHRQGRRQRPVAVAGQEPAPRQEVPEPGYESPPRVPREPKGPKELRRPPARQPGGSPRRLGRLLLVLILLLMAGAVAYALVFMPKADSDPGTGPGSPDRSSAPAAPADEDTDGADAGAAPSGGASAPPEGATGSRSPQTSGSADALPSGYALRKDTEGFEIGVPEDFRRTPANDRRQVRYSGGGFTVLVVPGRDTVEANGPDPLDYQRSGEPELAPFRESSWATSSGMRRIDVGRQAMAEGQFTWQEDGGREVYVRNLALIVSGRYHVVQVIGPESERDRVSDIYEQAVASYRAGS